MCIIDYIVITAHSDNGVFICNSCGMRMDPCGIRIDRCIHFIINLSELALKKQLRKTHVTKNYTN